MWLVENLKLYMWLTYVSIVQKYLQMLGTMPRMQLALDK